MESLSVRGRRGQEPALPYFGKFFSGMSQVYDPHKNPEGYCLLAVAENKTGVSETFLEKVASLNHDSIHDSSTMGYGDFSGLQKTRTVFASMANNTFLHGGGIEADPSNLVVCSGSGAVINHLALALMDPGDAVLLPTPTYAALKNDFGLIAGNVLQPVPFEKTGYRLTREILEAAFIEAERKGNKPKVLMLLHPHNPLGTVLSEEEMDLVLDFILSHDGMQLVSDEIYANSCWGLVEGDSGEQRFTSFVEAVERRIKVESSVADTLHSRVHCIWGLSKDWAASGLRFGALHTRNAALKAVISNYNYFSGVSHLTQDTVSAVLSDAAWTKDYLHAANESLRNAHDVAAATLTALGVPFVRPVAGMFIWLDLRGYLDGAVALARKLVDEPEGAAAPSSSLFAFTAKEKEALRNLLTEESKSPFWREHVLVELLWLRARVLLTPGEACMASEEGQFRCCFAWCSDAALKEGMQRLKAFLEEAAVPRRTSEH
jgi:aspartate/methionine/tyrosine aminotransferase